MLTDLLEFSLWEAGFAQEFAGEAQRIGEVGVQGAEGDRNGGGVAGDVDLRLEAVGLILNLLAVLGGGSAQEQATGHGSGGGFVEERLLVAEAEVDGGRDGAAAGLLGEHDELETVGQPGSDDAGLDVLRRGIEGLALLNGRAAVVVLEAQGRIGRGGNLRAIGSLGGNELTERAVGGLEIGIGHARHVGGGDLVHFVAHEVEGAPVAVARVSAKHEGNLLRVGERQFNVLFDACLGAIDLLLRGRIGGQTLDRLEQNLLGVVDVLVRLELHKCQRNPGVVHGLGAHADRDGLLGVDQRLVQPARLRSAQHLGHDFEGRDIGMQRGRNVVDRNDCLNVSDAAQGDETLAFLGGLDGVGLGEHSLGPGQCAEGLGDHGQRLGWVELSRDDEVGVVGLVVLVIEGREVCDGHTLDVGAVANDGFSIVMEVVCGGHDALVEDVELAVLAGLHFVADDRHLAVEVLLEHGHVGHAIGLQVQRPAEIVVAGVDGLEVHGLVV